MVSIDSIRAQVRKARGDSPAVPVIEALLDAAGDRWEGSVSWAQREDTNVRIHLTRAFSTDFTVTKSGKISRASLTTSGPDGEPRTTQVASRIEGRPAQIQEWLGRANDAVGEIDLLAFEVARTRRQYDDTMRVIAEYQTRLHERIEESGRLLDTLNTLEAQLGELTKEKAK